MKRKLVLCLLSVLLLFVSLALTVPLVNANEDEYNSVDKGITASYSSPPHSINLKFPKPSLTTVRGLTEKYDRLMLPDCSYITTPGSPALPIKVIIVKLNEGYDISKIEIEVKDEKLEGKYKIMPAPKPFPMMKNANKSNGVLSMPNLSIYQSKSLYPYNWFDYKSFHGIDPISGARIKYLAIHFYPLRYIPAEGTVIRAVNANLSIDYSGIEKVRELPASPTDLLIITPRSLKSQADSLAEWKNKSGIITKVVTAEWIYDNYEGIDKPEKIRNYIKDAVNKLGIRFVLIFGDVDKIPVRYAWIPDGYDDSGDTDGSIVETDLYYADLDYSWDDNRDGKWGDISVDKVEGIPDVYVGRLPASDSREASILVEKIKNYKLSPEWTNRYLLIGGDPFSDVDNVPEGEYEKEYIQANYLQNFQCTRLFKSLGNFTPKDTKEEIDKGYGFVDFFGHGEYNLWWFKNQGSYYNSDAFAQRNGNKTSVIFVGACLTSKFSDRDCIGEIFLLNPHGGGIAYYGASRVAWGYPGKYVIKGLDGEMDRRFTEALSKEYYYSGIIWGEALKNYVLVHPLTTWHPHHGYLDWKTVAEYGTLLGDPTLFLKSAIEEHEIIVINVKAPSDVVPFNETTIHSVIGNYGRHDERNVSVQLLINGKLVSSKLVSNKLVSTYDRKAAYNYAQKYWNKVCSDGYFFKVAYPPSYLGAETMVPTQCGLDCAHFVSCCIGNETNETGGGLDILSRTKAYGEPGADKLRKLLLDSDMAIEKNSFNELERGDVIFYDWNGNGRWNHSALYLGNGEVAAHSWSKWTEDTEESWTLGDAKNYSFIHITPKIISYLKNMSSIGVDFNWTSSDCGNFNATIYAVPVNGENNTENNIKSVFINVHSLYINYIDAPREVEDGDTFILTVNASNKGNYTVTGANATISLPSGLSTSQPSTKPIGNGTIMVGRSGEAKWRITAEEISEDREYTIPVDIRSLNGGSDKGGGKVKVRNDEKCIIFTAAYGSPMVTQVQMLCHFRDDIAPQTKIGKEFFKVFNFLYYSFSPEIAQFISSNEIIRASTRFFLTPFVSIAGTMDDISELFGGEIGILASFLTVGLLTGVVYLSPIFIAFSTIPRRHHKVKAGRRVKIIELTLFLALLCSLLLTFSGYIIGVSAFSATLSVCFFSSIILSHAIHNVLGDVKER